MIAKSVLIRPKASAPGRVHPLVPSPLLRHCQQAIQKAIQLAIQPAIQPTRQTDKQTAQPDRYAISQLAQTTLL